MSDDLVRRLRARAFRLATMNLNGSGAALAKDSADLIEQQAATIEAQAAEIERIRQEGLVKDSAISEAAKLAKKLMTRAVQAEQEHTDMMWQRRRADERADAAESVLAEAVEVMRPFASDDLSDCTDCVDNDGKPYQSQWLADSRAKARAFVQQHEGKK